MNESLSKGSVCFLTLDMGFGGAEKVIATLANKLSESGREVTIVTFLDQNDFSNVLDTRIKIDYLSVKNFKTSFFVLCNYLHKNRFDNFIANIWPLTIFSLPIRFFSRKTNLVFIEHCILSEQYKSKHLIFKFLLKLSISMFYRFAHHVVCVSQGVKDDLISFGVPKNKSLVIFNPLMPAFSNACDLKNKKIRNWIQGSSINLVAVGQLIQAKNFLNLIKSINILVHREKYDLRLLVLGDGEERVALEDAINEYSLGQHVYLPGWVEDPIPFIESSDLLVLSSDYEGFGLVIIEALSVGVNVVSTNCKTGPSEILKGGEFGFLCAVNDEKSLSSSIKEALKKPLPKNKLLERASDFSPRKITEEYEKILI